MATYQPPKKNIAWIGYISLVSQASTLVMQSNPTIASGDFKVAIDGGALANLATLPTVTPSSSKMVKISLSTSEMNGDNITIVCSDAAGAEWCDLVFNLQTSARQIDDLAYPATSGRSMVVDANGLVDANTVKIGPTGSGTAQTARDVGASVLLSTGTGTGQLDFTSGVVKANLTQILGTALTETAGLIAAGFKQFFNIASPTSTMNIITTVTTSTNLTTNNDKTGYGLSAAAIQAIWDALTSALTTVGSIGKLLVDNINATISSRLASASYTTPPTVAQNRAEMDSSSTSLAAIKTQTDKLTFTVANQIDANVLDWKNATAPAMTGDAFARLGAPVGANTSADIAAVKSDSTTILGQTGTTGVIVATNNDKTGYGLSAAAVTAVWVYITEGTWTVVKQVRLWSSILLGKNSGMGTTTGTFRDIDDTKDRVVVTQDASGNRSAFGTKDGT